MKVTLLGHATILVEMDGFDARTNIIVVAATNRPDVLDQALLRPGRFDRQILLDRPDRQGRLAIMKVHARGKPIEPEVDLEGLARTTAGFSGADLENLMNEAALRALDAAGGFQVGVGPSVVVLDEGKAKSFTTQTLTSDSYAFIFGQQGLMAGVGLEGTKITRLKQ